MEPDINQPYDRDADIARLKQEVYVASRVGELIGDELVSATLNGMLHGLQNEWLLTKNSAERESLWLRAQGLQEFLATLRSLIDSGKMAAQQLESMKNDE